MANVCSAQELLDQARCFGVLNQHQMNLVTLGLLRQILLDNNPMANVDVQALLDAAKCFERLNPFQMAMVRTQLLCEILNVGIQQGCVYCSASSDPVDPPACDCALFYRRDNGTMWFWDPDDVEWVALLT